MRPQVPKSSRGVTMQNMKSCAVLLAAAGLCLAADTLQKYTGTIGDDMCKGDHKAMGGTDPARCVAECVKGMGAKYTLWADKNIYVLSDQKAAAKYAGKKVTVTGVLTGTDLQVKSISPDKAAAK
jgi:hypothetical protein